MIILSHEILSFGKKIYINVNIIQTDKMHFNLNFVNYTINADFSLLYNYNQENSNEPFSSNELKIS